MYKNTSKILEKIIADTYALYLKTHNYHWNIEGPNFYQFHKLLEDLYEELAESLDTLAERKRALGSKVSANFISFSKLTTIKDPDENLKEMEMIEDLYKSNLEIIESLKIAQETASNEGDVGTEDMLIERLQVHYKTAWMLKSVLS